MKARILLVLTVLALGASCAQGFYAARHQYEVVSFDLQGPMKKPSIESLPGIDWALHWIALGIEAVGVAIIFLGALVSTAVFLYRLVKEKSLDDCYQRFRSAFGKAILLGLEFLVASDIVSTVAVGLTFKDLGLLGLLVLIRTLLSFALEVEINGHWPWKSSEVAMKLTAK
ncbi:MAG: DUF1622 domain-containing protein [Thermodesulfobacteriota bacterium]